MTTPSVDPDRIVVGVDGSTPSDDALLWGRFLAESIGGTLQAVFAWPSIAEWASPWVAAGSAAPRELDPGKDATQFLDQTWTASSWIAVRPGCRPPWPTAARPRPCCRSARAPGCWWSAAAATAGSPACSSARSAQPAPNTPTARSWSSTA